MSIAKFVFDNDVFINSNTQVSDPGISALGTGLKELKSLTNLSLHFRYFYFNSLIHFRKTLSQGFFHPPAASESPCVLSLNIKNPGVPA